MSTITEIVSSASKKYNRVENVMRYVSVKSLKAAHNKQDGKKAKGIDKVTKEEYGQKLEENLEELIQWRQFKGKLVLSCCLCRHQF